MERFPIGKCFTLLQHSRASENQRCVDDPEFPKELQQCWREIPFAMYSLRNVLALHKVRRVSAVNVLTTLGPEHFPRLESEIYVYFQFYGISSREEEEIEKPVYIQQVSALPKAAAVEINVIVDRSEGILLRKKMENGKVSSQCRSRSPGDKLEKNILPKDNFRVHPNYCENIYTTAESCKDHDSESCYSIPTAPRPRSFITWGSLGRGPLVLHWSHGIGLIITSQKSPSHTIFERRHHMHHHNVLHTDWDALYHTQTCLSQRRKVVYLKKLGCVPRPHPVIFPGAPRSRSTGCESS